MALKREDYENLLTELLSPELEQARKTEILTTLRDDKTETSTEYETLAKTKEKLERDNADLVISNSKLFRQTGILGQSEPKKQEDEKKEFSETVTIADFEKTL